MRTPPVMNRSFSREHAEGIVHNGIDRFLLDRQANTATTVMPNLIPAVHGIFDRHPAPFWIPAFMCLWHIRRKDVIEVIHCRSNNSASLHDRQQRDLQGSFRDSSGQGVQKRDNLLILLVREILSELDLRHDHDGIFQFIH
jgi:hypothetical protein